MPVGRETVNYYPRVSETIKPEPLVTSADVAKVLGLPDAWIYSMTVSPDGDYLALTVTPATKGSWRQWWLVQYRVIRPVAIPVSELEPPPPVNPAPSKPN
jgi:hypothetical protein